MATGLGLYKARPVANVLSLAAVLRTSLVVAVRPIIFLSSRDGNGQTILFRCERTSGVRSHRAGRIVGPVKVDHDRAIHDRVSFQEAASRIGVGLFGGIVETERKAFRRITTQ